MNVHCKKVTWFHKVFMFTVQDFQIFKGVTCLQVKPGRIDRTTPWFGKGEAKDLLWKTKLHMTATCGFLRLLRFGKAETGKTMAPRYSERCWKCFSLLIPVDTGLKKTYFFFGGGALNSQHASHCSSGKTFFTDFGDIRFILKDPERLNLKRHHCRSEMLPSSWSLIPSWNEWTKTNTTSQHLQDCQMVTFREFSFGFSDKRKGVVWSCLLQTGASSYPAHHWLASGRDIPFQSMFSRKRCRWMDRSFQNCPGDGCSKKMCWLSTRY